jgi:cytidylate kinase
MKKKVSVQSWHDIEVTIKPEDIEVIFDNLDDGTLTTWLIQLNDVAIFLKGTPNIILNSLSEKQANVIIEALMEICERIKRNCT